MTRTYYEARKCDFCGSASRSAAIDDKPHHEHVFQGWTLIDTFDGTVMDRCPVCTWDQEEDADAANG